MDGGSFSGWRFSCLCCILGPFLTHKRLVDRQLNGEAVSQSELREAAHASIRWLPNHDAFITLTEVGDETSVRSLIRSLRFVPQDDSGISCAFLHCRDALKQITGEDFGFDADAWERWWAEAGDAGKRR